MKEKNNLKGSLNKLAHYLNVEREGKNHQAGSDSYVTIDVFWKLIANKYLTKEELLGNKNILFGISKGKDNEETINYIKINKINEMSIKNNNNFNNINNMGNNMNNTNYYENNNLFYMPLNRNVYNYGINYFYPQMKMNQINNGFNYFQRLINNNNIAQYA